MTSKVIAFMLLSKRPFGLALPWPCWITLCILSVYLYHSMDKLKRSELGAVPHPSEFSICIIPVAQHPPVSKRGATCLLMYLRVRFRMHLHPSNRSYSQVVVEISDS